MNCDKHTLLHDTYLCNSQMIDNGKHCWGSNILHFLNTIGMSKLRENSVYLGKHRIRNKVNTAIDKMKQIYKSKWINELNRTESGDKKGGN